MSNTWNGSATNEQYLELPADKDQQEQASNEKGNFGELVSKSTGRSVPLNQKAIGHWQWPRMSPANKEQIGCRVRLPVNVCQRPLGHSSAR